MIEFKLSLLAYVGPETVLPVASALAAIVGASLTFGRSLKMMALRCWRTVTRRGH